MLAVTLLFLGTITSQWVILLWGEALAVLVTCAYYLHLATFQAVEGGFLGLSLRGRGANRWVRGTVGRPETLEMEVVNLSGVHLARLRLDPEHSEEIHFDPGPIELASLGGHRRVGFGIMVSASASGRWMLHGFRLCAEGTSGLVAVSEYIPMTYPFKFQPAVAASRQALIRKARRFAEMHRMGAHPLWQRGVSTNFRELRDHTHGDPFRNIAWKATARTGKLMVRQFEDEVFTNTSIILDISSTMRGGTPPKTKLSHAVELIAELATTTVRARDRIGLVTFDEVVYGHIRTTDGKSGVPQLINHLVGLGCVVDNDFTEQDEQEVTETVVNYLAIQDRLEFRRRGGGRKDLFEDDWIDRELLVNWLRRTLKEESVRLGDPVYSAGVVGYPRVSGVRRFCQLRGVPLPYRRESRFGAKEGGMVQALERFLEDTRESHFVVLVSDLCALVEMRRIEAALKLVLSRKHRVMCWMPYTPDYVRGAEEAAVHGRADQWTEAMERVFRLAEHRERSRAAAVVTSLGIPVLPVSPVDTLETLLARSSLSRRSW